MQNGGPVLVQRCPKCMRQLPLGSFYRRYKQSDKLSSYCSECVRAVLSDRRDRLRKIHDERTMADVTDALREGAPIDFGALTRNTRRELLDTLDTPGTAAASIAVRVGCSTVTVYRHRRERKMRGAGRS